MRVKFSESAHLDIVDGWHFYNSQQDGLGDEGVVVYAVIGNKRNPDWIDEHLSLAR